MEGRQKQLIERAMRVKAFLVANPAPAPATYSEPKQILDEVVAELSGHSVRQESGFRLSKAALREQEVAIRKLREHHLRPIATIARASVKQQPGIAEAAKMPSAQLGVTKLTDAAESIRDTCRNYEALFVRLGRPADFIQQLTNAIAAVEGVTEGRGTTIGNRAGSKRGMDNELKRGTLAIDMLDAIVRVAFEDKPDVLEAWRIAKRVRALPGGGPRAVNSVVVPAPVGAPAVA